MPTRSSWLLLALSASLVGCGSTKSRMATEQLLVSDAVDEAVAKIDFRSLSGENVFFDTRYLVNAKGVGFVNAEYIISSLRQQMVAADLRLKEKSDDAEFIIEARIGTLGTDGNEIVYGVPANKGLSEASSVIPNSPTLPVIPEISIARKESQVGAAKIGVFAYERKTGAPVWQSGIAKSRTTSQDMWLFGAGPFQRGSIHSGTTFAGGEMRFPARAPDDPPLSGPPVDLAKEFRFPRGPGPLALERPVLANHTAPAGPPTPAPALTASGPPAAAPRPAPPELSVPSESPRLIPVDRNRPVPLNVTPGTPPGGATRSETASREPAKLEPAPLAPAAK